MKSKNLCLGEVIESSLHIWQVQTWQWDTVPAFGSLVSVQSGDREIIGVVYGIETGSSDSSRVPQTYQKTEEELRREQPQIFSLLRTKVACLTLGYRQNGHIQYALAPQPPKIHAFVASVDSAESVEFLGKSLFLHTLFSCESMVDNLDELLVALVRECADKQILDALMIGEFVKTFSLLSGNDYRRLKLFLTRVGQFLPATHERATALTGSF